MRVMLDTNVLLSAFIFRSSTLTKTIELASTGDNQLLLSTYVIDEGRNSDSMIGGAVLSYARESEETL